MGVAGVASLSYPFDKKTEKEREDETEKGRQTGCFLTAENYCAASTKLETLACGTKEEIILLRVIPTETEFCHGFRHLIWKYNIWHIFSDILFWHSILA